MAPALFFPLYYPSFSLSLLVDWTARGRSRTSVGKKVFLAREINRRRTKKHVMTEQIHPIHLPRLLISYVRKEGSFPQNPLGMEIKDGKERNGILPSAYRLGLGCVVWRLGGSAWKMYNVSAKM